MSWTRRVASAGKSSFCNHHRGSTAANTVGLVCQLENANWSENHRHEASLPPDAAAAAAIVAQDLSRLIFSLLHFPVFKIVRAILRKLKVIRHCHTVSMLTLLVSTCLPPPAPADPSLLLLPLRWYVWALTEVSGVTLPLLLPERSGNRGFNALKPVGAQNKANSY